MKQAYGTFDRPERHAQGSREESKSWTVTAWGFDDKPILYLSGLTRAAADRKSARLSYRVDVASIAVREEK